ncbi:MAG TPA: M20/M25/M40 family metallo-hydrolase [Pyrinomonadaceae bacterium]
MKRLHLTIVLAILSCSLWKSVSITAAAAGLIQQNKADASPLITPEMVKPHVVKLADDKYEGRGAGYRGERQAGEYIADEFKRIGLKPAGDSGRGRRSYYQEFRFHPYHPVVAWELMTSRNILGLIEGSDPALKNEIVVIGAHYDGQGRAGQADPTRQPPGDAAAIKDEIWNSANDNATSVAAILEIARAIKRTKVAPKRSILFIAFGAEEHGMTGSIYYVHHPVFPLGNHVAMINLEKLGRSPEKPLNINGSASSPVWAEVLKEAQGRTQTKVSTGSPYAFPDSDHYPFGALRIPAVIFSVSTSVDAHQPSDTADKIDFPRLAEAARFAMAMLLSLTDQPQRPVYVASPIPDLGLIAHLVTNAEASASGLGAEESGLKVTGVIAGSSSADAGLQEGDLILEVAKIRLRRDAKLAELMAMQRQVLEGKLGYRLPVTILRDGKRRELVINLRR